MSTKVFHRVAVLSDLHGNICALDAVLEEVDRLDVDQIILNGDLAAGPCPEETMDRLIALGERAIWIRGNSDRAMVDCFDAYAAGRPVPAVDPVDHWAAGRIAQDHRDRLAAAAMSASVSIAGLGDAWFFHATARDDEEIFLADDTEEHFRSAFPHLPREAAVVVLGHTHMPFDRTFEGHRVVNAGSVGMPYGGSGAAWLLLGPGVTFCRTLYDVDAAAARLSRSPMPGVSDFIADHVRASPTAAEATAVMSGLRERQKQRWLR